MATLYPAHPSALLVEERHVLHSITTMLRVAFGIVPIVAGADKFTNVLTQWDRYLNPALLRLVPLGAAGFMHIVGLVEIVAGVLLLVKPRIGAFVAAAWLLAIALQLVAGWMHLDVAVRDIVLAVGAITLARLVPIANAHDAARRE